MCAVGYSSATCSVCMDGFFLQFGRCVVCPKVAHASVFIQIASSLGIAAAAGLFFKYRRRLPTDVMKVGITMIQIIAAANTAYEIPWPPEFKNFLSVLELFLADVISLTRANCTTPMTFYTSMVIVLLGFKVLLLLVLGGPWLIVSVRSRTGGLVQYAAARFQSTINSRLLRRRPSAMLPRPSIVAAHRMRRVGTEAVIVGAASPMNLRLTTFLRVDWTKIFKSCFLLLFVAYAAVSIKVLRMFRCRKIEGTWYLVADMRLECFTATWWSYATYAAVMGVAFVLGLPLLVFVTLFRHRHTLYGDKSGPTRARYGFLYEVYGQSAWWWEVEELLRRLVLTAIVVLMEASSPVQVTIAVMVCGWSHVLHSVFKPWSSSRTYYLQHASLFVTSFVFLMGLLFKTRGVKKTSPVYHFLSVFMLILVCLFLLFFVTLFCHRLWLSVQASRVQRLETKRLQELAEQERLANVAPITGRRCRTLGGDVEAVVDLEPAPSPVEGKASGGWTGSGPEAGSAPRADGSPGSAAGGGGGRVGEGEAKASSNPEALVFSTPCVNPLAATRIRRMDSSGDPVEGHRRPSLLYRAVEAFKHRSVAGGPSPGTSQADTAGLPTPTSTGASPRRPHRPSFGERTRIIMRKVRAPDSGSGSPTLGTPSGTPAAMDTPAVVFFDNPLRAVPTP